MAEPKKVPIDMINLPQPAPQKARDHLAAYKGWVYSAITLISNEASSVPIGLYKRLSNGDIEEVEDHPCLETLHFVNDHQTWQQLREITFTYQDLLGEAVWLLLPVNGEIRGIIPLRPDWLKIVPDGKGGITKYVYYPNGSMVTSSKGVDLDTEFVIFFKDFDPLNMYRGYGKVRAMAMDIDIDDFSDQWNRNYFFNSAIPSLIMSTDAVMDKSSKKRFINKWQQQYGGRQNANKVALLDGGKLNVQEIGSNVQELDFHNSKERLMQKILAGFHLSKSNLGITDDVNRANATAQNIRFMRNVIVPRLVTFVGFLNEFYLPKFENTDELFFNFEDPTPDDLDAKYSRLQIASVEGWMTTNEIRGEIGLDPLEGGDVIYRPFNLQPVAGDVQDAMAEQPENDDDENDDENEEQRSGLLGRLIDKVSRRKSPGEFVAIMRGRPAEKAHKHNFGAPIPPRRPQKRRQERVYKEIKHEIKRVVVELMKSGRKERKQEPLENAASIMTSEEKQAFWKQFESETIARERQIKDLIRPLLKDQRDLVLKKIRDYRNTIDNGRKPASLQSLLYSLDKENKAWKKTLRPFVASIIQQKGQEAIDMVLNLGERNVSGSTTKQSQDFDMTAEEVLEYLDGVGMIFIDQANETTRDMILDSLDEGLSSGETTQQLASRVTEIYSDLDKTRLKFIAMAGVVTVFNFAFWSGYKQSGVVVGKEWLTALDSKVRPAHKDALGQVVPIDEPFDVDGEKLMYPRDPNGSAGNVINCRCTELPVTVSQVRSLYSDMQRKDRELTEAVYNDVIRKLNTVEANKKLQNAVKTEEQARRKLEKTNEVTGKVIDDAVEVVSEAVKRRARIEDKRRLERDSEDMAILDGEKDKKRLESKKLDQIIENEVKEIDRLNATKGDIVNRIEADEESKRLAEREKTRETIEAERKRREKVISKLGNKYDSEKRKLEIVQRSVEQAQNRVKDSHARAKNILKQARKSASEIKDQASDEYRGLRDRVQKAIDKVTK